MADKTHVVAEYIAEVAKLAKTGITTEHSFRPAMENLLSELFPELKPINEPKRQACGAPDFILIDKNNLPVMFVETKDLGDSDLDGRKRNGNKEQFTRYKAALDTIIFTDFLDFHFYRHNGQCAGVVKIGERDGTEVTAKSEKFTDFVKLMEESACSKPEKIKSAKRLAELMAGKARMLQRTAERYLTPLVKAFDSAPLTAKPKATPLLDMMLDFRRVLMQGIGSEEFSDIFAQTLTYGMFAARLNDPDPETFSRYEAMGRIPNSNPFLKQLFQYVANNLEEELEWIVDDLADLFRAVDAQKVMSGYGKFTGASDPMVHFYEDFLEKYDAKLRKNRGVWYTPIQVVRFIVAAVDWALKNRFGLEDGLADSSTTQIEVEEIAMNNKKKYAHKVKKTVHRVQVLDPATGTGTFLAEAVRQIREKFVGNEGRWPEYVEKDLLPRLNGFELLMASYTMAHVKLDFALRESGVTPSGKNRFRVFLTDSLSEWHDEPPAGLFASALGAEQEGADEVKRDTPVMVVMGNPPYSGESQNKGDWIMRLMKAYKVEPGGKVKLQERNPKWLNDDYVKFIRLAEHYIGKNGSGIIAYITPHGFLDNPTFRGMRWHLMETFDEIWTLNLHGNSKKKEVAPDGGKDECVFSIKQGVAISLFVKRDSKDKIPCKVYYADLWGKKKKKLAALESATMDSIKWQELNPVEPMLFFVPKDTESGETEWFAGFGISELMAVNSSGVVSANDELNFSFTVDEQQEKINDLLSMAEHDWRQKYHRLKDSTEWKYYDARNDTRNSGLFCNVSYRLFDERVTFYTGTTKGLYTRPREDVMHHFVGNENIGLVVKRGFPYPVERAVGFVAENLIDNRFWSCSGMQGIDYFFPLWLYEKSEGYTEKHANMNPEIVARIGEAIGGEASPEDIFAYIYGVLHTPQYREKFRDFLKSGFPRIPYPKDATQFNEVAEIGRSLIDTHLMRDAVPGLSETRARFPKMGSNMVEEFRFDDSRVYINAEQYFDNVPKQAWEMPIGGYQPAQKWLKDRKGRVLSGDDIKHYQRIILALMKTAEATEKLAEVYSS
ncbi:MAG: DNA methyltransferase [Lentisphaerae bacterium]|nr:DNA methyltransferase [Lentisphaerota bacterium]